MYINNNKKSKALGRNIANHRVSDPHHPMVLREAKSEVRSATGTQAAITGIPEHKNITRKM